MKSQLVGKCSVIDSENNQTAYPFIKNVLLVFPDYFYNVYKTSYE